MATSRRGWPSWRSPAVQPAPEPSRRGRSSSPPMARAACCGKATGCWSKSASTTAPLAGVDDLRAAGAKIVDVSRRYQTSPSRPSPASCRRLADVARVAGVTRGARADRRRPTCPSGASRLGGRPQLDAAEARGGLRRVDGSGVTVGILSDSFDQRLDCRPTRSRDDVDKRRPARRRQPLRPDDAGRRPRRLRSQPKATDEGRAMAQIVHDLAPGRRLAFATAFTATSPSPKTSKNWPTQAPT